MILAFKHSALEDASLTQGGWAGIQTDRRRNTHTDRQRNTHTETDWQIDRHTDRQTDKQTNKQTDWKYTERLTDRQTDRWIDRQTDRQTAIIVFIPSTLDFQNIDSDLNAPLHSSLFCSFTVPFMQKWNLDPLGIEPGRLNLIKLCSLLSSGTLKYRKKNSGSV